MAIERMREQIDQLLDAELDERRRYRCLVLQTADLALLSEIGEAVRHHLANVIGEPRVLEWNQFFDEVGALSGSQVRTRVESEALRRPVVLEGPLHFLDYWTDLTQAGFWGFLSAFSQGPGIVVLDTPRMEAVEGPFRVQGKIVDSEVRFLRLLFGRNTG